MNNSNEKSNTELVPVEVLETNPVQSFANVDVIIKAELDNQITTARAFPRSIDNFIHKAKSLALYDLETAESCFYSLPRDGKMVEGPSVRLAEIIFSTYGNLRAGSQVISNDGKKLVSRGYCHDLETNVMVSMEVTRRITYKTGKTYNEDMQVVTGNAANAISFRNAIFKVIPMSLTKSIISEIKKLIKGTIKDIKTRRNQALLYFEKLGVKKEKIFEILEVKGLEDIGEDELLTLIGFVNAINNGETTIEDCFPAVKPESEKAKAGEQQVIDGIDKINENKTKGKK